MPLNRFVGQEPITVTDVSPGRFAELTKTVYRFSLSAGSDYNVVKWIGPSPSERWKIEAVQLELLTSGNAGTRYVYLYQSDRTGSTSRYLALVNGASAVMNHVAQPGMPYSNSSFGISSGTTTGPLYTSYLENPCQIGAMITNFQDLADSLALVVWYRNERSVY